MSDQMELDQLFNKIENNYKNVTNKEITRLVELINYKYSGNDIILKHLTKFELIRCADYITRATYELTKRRGIFDTSSKHYILSNLCKARLGLDSSSRKKIFAENHLFIEEEIDYRGTYIRFRFIIYDQEPILLLKYIYGYGSITNWIEKILIQIENNYITDIGYGIISDNVPIYYKDIHINGMEGIYDKVTLEHGFINPKWKNVDPVWFEEVWESVDGAESTINEPVFLQKNQPYTGYKKVKEILNTAKKKLQIIDPYIDGSFFTLIEELNKKIKICVITDKFQGDSKLLYEKFKKERGNIEIQTSKENHDRYVIIDEKLVYLFGSSINSLGNKSTTIVPIDNSYVKSSIINYFVKSWNAKESNE